jgi:hypothetical protein
MGWEKEHQLVIENKCCENKNKNVEIVFVNPDFDISVG